MTSNTPVTQALEPVTPELLPCPFCGGEAKWIEDPSVCGVPFGLVVDHQPSCFFDLFASITDAEQIARWNTRQSSSNAGGVDWAFVRECVEEARSDHVGYHESNKPGEPDTSKYDTALAALASLSTPTAEPTGIERSKVAMLERYLRRARRILGSTPSKIADDIDAYFSGNALTTPPTPDQMVTVVVCATCGGEFDEGEWDADTRCPECEQPKRWNEKRTRLIGTNPLPSPTPDRIGKDAVREALREAAETLSWAARRMKGSCRGSDIDAVNLAAGNAIRALSATPAQPVDETERLSPMDKRTFLTCVSGDGPTPYLKVHFKNLADAHAAHDELLGVKKEAD